MEDALFRGNREPTLDQILAEPIVRQLMQRDGIDETALRRLMHRAATEAFPPKLRFVAPVPPTDEGPPRASLGVLAQASTMPAWPRVFPSL